MTPNEQQLLQQLHQSQEETERWLLLQQEYKLRCQQLQLELSAQACHLQQNELLLSRLYANCKKQAELNQHLLNQLALTLQHQLPATLPADMQTDYLLAYTSGLFDQAAYLSSNPDVAAANIDPLQHYLQHGGIEGRSCGKAFNSPAYLAHYPDVAQTGINPLLHYLRYGMAEGRTDQP